MMIVSSDGYIISMIGPYLTDFTNNGASMIRHIFGIPNLHACLLGKKTDSQLTTAEANETRFVTKIRWVVESANGTVKTWGLFDRVMANSMIPITGDLLSIVCTLINAYRPLFVRDVSNDDKVANTILGRVNQGNELKDYIDRLKNEKEKKSKWIRIDANDAVRDFPILDLD
ncbi:unnamed protein product [Adineta ricciae]|uniref:DDE Tnp4 domain-containing protein n=1 Tax=Adineta ricciae TaxID=249248 RepID=A0A815KNW3_ADIRI|nr:unnamed protein product [Adineta ricciae]